MSFMQIVINAECCAKCYYAKCHFAECHYAECHYAECHYAKCYYAECYYDERRYAVHRYAECRGQLSKPLEAWIVGLRSIEKQADISLVL